MELETYVPQGSVLGALLIVIYISYLNVNVQGMNGKFADESLTQ